MADVLLLSNIRSHPDRAQHREQAFAPASEEFGFGRAPTSIAGQSQHSVAGGTLAQELDQVDGHRSRWPCEHRCNWPSRVRRSPMAGKGEAALVISRQRPDSPRLSWREKPERNSQHARAAIQMRQMMEGVVLKTG
jgi:hypothetical protein